MGNDLGYVSVKGKGSSECILSSSNMHFTAHIGNIRRPSSYHNCSPGTHPTQPMRLPTPARSECTHPCRTANAAQVGERAQAQHSTHLDDHLISPQSTQIAVCSAQAMSAFHLSISAHIGPCGAPFAVSILDIVVGQPPVSLALHKAQ